MHATLSPEPAFAGETGLRLNVGGGTGPELPGYDVVDIKTGDDAYPLTFRGRRVADGSVDEIYASHVLEHFSHLDTEKVLAEWVRALRPGGTLRVAVPDLDRVLAARQKGDPNWRHCLMGGHVDEHDVHAAVFDEWGIRRLLRAAGLRHVRRWQPVIDDCASHPVSVNVEGVKASKSDYSLTHGVMSVPRLGFMDNFRCASQALGPMGIQINWGFGAYWEKTITWTIEASIAAGAKYLLAIDYDTVFTRAAVEDLHWLMETTPDADAICAVQMQRGKNRALACVADENGGLKQRVTLGDFEGELTPLLTGHFGLTLIRADAFAKLPMPWFKSVPDANNTWSDTSTDADIVFWRQFVAAGNKLYQANHVAVGHAELMVTWPDRMFHPLHQYPNEYQVNGPPPNARW